MTKILRLIGLLVIAGLPTLPAMAHPGPPPAGAVKPPQKHALVSMATVVSAPVTHPVRTLKQVFGSIVFGAENVVDVAHGGFNLADKAFDALSVQGKIPVLDSIYAVVGTLNTDTGKLDTWMEKEETYLFGTSN